MSDDHQLEKSLSLGPAIGLAITMVVGSGLLVLPGLAYSQVGTSAIYAWLISATAVGPILIIFSALGSKLPNAGGVAGFMQAAFGRSAGMATEILLLGAIPGGAAIAITGGQYFAAILDGSQFAMLSGTGLVLITGGLVNYLGAHLSGKIQQYLAFLLVILLSIVAVVSLAFSGQSGGIAPFQDWQKSLPAFGLVFFAFVGWEMMAFTSEEFKNPRRDFPLMMFVSYAIVVILYALITVATQWIYQPNDPMLVRAPIAGMLSKVMGPASGKLVAGIGFVLVLANFISVVWAFSRLIFSSAREGLLPPALARLNRRGKIPTWAIVAVTLVFGLFVLAYFFNLVSHSILFELAGISFFFSYFLAIVVYLKLARTLLQKALGIFVFGLTAGLYLSFGPKGFYAIALFLVGLFLSKVRK